MPVGAGLFSHPVVMIPYLTHTGEVAIISTGVLLPDILGSAGRWRNLYRRINMAIIDNLLVQLWIASLMAMVVIGVIISVWAAWRTISKQRSQLLAVNTELDLRVTDLSTEISRRQ